MPFIPSQGAEPRSGARSLIEDTSRFMRAVGLGGVSDILSGTYAAGQAAFDPKQRSTPLLKRTVTPEMTQRNPFGDAEAIQRLTQKPYQTGARAGAGIASWMIPTGPVATVGRGLVPKAVETIVRGGTAGALQAASQPDATVGDIGTGAAVGSVVNPLVQGGVGALSQGGKLLTEKLPAALSKTTKQLQNRWASWLGGKNSADYAVKEGLVPAEIREIDRGLIDEVATNVTRKFESLNQNLNQTLSRFVVPAQKARDVVFSVSRPIPGDPDPVKLAKERFASQADEIIRQATAGEITLATMNEIKRMAWENYGNKFYNNAGRVVKDFIEQEAGATDPLAAQTVQGINDEMSTFLIPMNRRIRQILSSKGGEAFPTLEKFSAGSPTRQALTNTLRVAGSGALLTMPFVPPTARFMLAGSMAPVAVNEFLTNPSAVKTVSTGLQKAGELGKSKVAKLVKDLVTTAGPRILQSGVQPTQQGTVEEEMAKLEMGQQ